MFLLQLALALLPLIHLVAFYVQLPFVFLPEKTLDSRVATITSCCASTTRERAEKVSWDGKKDVNRGLLVISNTGPKGPTSRHINKRQPTGHGCGQSSHNFSGYCSETPEQQDALEVCVKLQDCCLTQMMWAGWYSSHSGCSTVMGRQRLWEVWLGRQGEWAAFYGSYRNA